MKKYIIQKLTQKAFLKDIIERFNLVFIADPDNAANIIVETYDDYLSQSTTLVVMVLLGIYARDACLVFVRYLYSLCL